LTLAIDIRKVRRKLGMTQADFASKLDVSQSAISNWESGRDKPDINNLYRLVEITGDHWFLSREALIEAPEEVPRAKLTPTNGLVDGLLDILSRLEALEQQVHLLLNTKKKAGTR
jgi:transcriptional regulator with XRE-family HTH domain